MKRAIAVTLGLLVGGSVIGSLLAARSTGSDPYKYLVAKIPANSVETEIDEKWHVSHNAKQTVVTPLDYFGKDGWELVSAVREPDGTYVCFFKAPK